MSDYWRNELCDFCSDMPIFCMACYCRQCVQAQALDMATGEGCCDPLCQAMCLCCFGEANNRQKFREFYGIPGSYGEDCHVMTRLPLCGTIQMYKEVLDRIQNRQDQIAPPVEAQHPSQGGQYPQSPPQYPPPKGDQYPPPPSVDYPPPSVDYPPPPGQYPPPPGQYPPPPGQYPPPPGQYPPPPGQYPPPSGQYPPPPGQYTQQEQDTPGKTPAIDKT